MERYLGALLIVSLIFLAKDFVPASPVFAQALGSSVTSTPPPLQPVTTISSFDYKLSQQIEVIPRNTVYQDDPTSEIGTETVIDPGADGQKIQTIKTSFYQGQQYDQSVVDEKIIPAKAKIIAKGTKIIWRTLNIPDGQISYFRSIHVWATQYDSHCPGCSNHTATGLLQGKGVIAVDPSVIPLGTKLYIPGYGIAVAGDVGGAVRGNMIDVGFPDAHTSGWISHSVDVYLMSN